VVGQELAQTGAHHGMVVDDGNTDHGFERMTSRQPAERKG
jgi:hypothetical protein